MPAKKNQEQLVDRKVEYDTNKEVMSKGRVPDVRSFWLHYFYERSCALLYCCCLNNEVTRYGLGVQNKNTATYSPRRFRLLNIFVGVWRGGGVTLEWKDASIKVPHKRKDMTVRLLQGYLAGGTHRRDATEDDCSLPQ